MQRTSIAVVWLVLLSLASSFAQDDPPLVQTKDGPVMGGLRKSQEGRSYMSFEGIPFAAPPVNNLRFAPPSPVTPWEETLDVSGTSDVKCTQYGYMSEGGSPDISGSEDCLYLNVWTPNTQSSEPLPVLMWIYGGSLTAGSNAYYEYGPMRWIDQDVIVVSPLYRLGPFGFTSLGIDEAPGNQGFLDLVQALHWIQDNIELFGGDPSRVTIFGESSGSWAVSYLHISPLANGLFHRAIAQSGSLLNPFWLWQTKEDAVGLSTFMSTTLTCPSVAEDPYAALECLQSLPANVIEDTGNWGTEETFNIQKILRPTGTVDGKFLPDSPITMMENGDFNHVDIIYGVTKDEGLLQTYQLELHPELWVPMQFLWEQTFGPMFLFGRAGDYATWDKDREMVKDITAYYLGEEGVANMNRDHFSNITDMISDAYIWYGAYKQSSLAAAAGDNVYRYMFSFKGTYGFADSFGLDNSLYGVCHADELFYFWKPYYFKSIIKFPEREELLSQRVVASWANFARTGNPSVAEMNINWDPITASNPNWMNIGEEWSMEVSEDFLTRMSVWDDIYVYPTGNTLPPQPQIKKVKGQYENLWTQF